MRRSSRPSGVSVHRKQGSKLTIPAVVLLLICFLSQTVQAKYSGGTGTPDAPYQIATTEDLMLLGEDIEDCDRHFRPNDVQTIHLREANHV